MDLIIVLIAVYFLIVELPKRWAKGVKTDDT